MTGVDTPLVSIAVSTRNEEEVIGNLFQSIQQQTYRHYEVLVIDNNSPDRTREIAAEGGATVLVRGPERSVQRNFGVQQAKGQYVLILDADMELAPTVLAECVQLMQAHPECRGIIIPEESFGEGFWAACKALERSCYAGDDAIEAARFFDRVTFIQIGGYDGNLIAGEDWDLSQRVRQTGAVLRVASVIRHNEGRLSLLQTLRKKRYYGRNFIHYARKHGSTAVQQGNLVLRPAFFRSWRKLARHPLLLGGMLLMKLLEAVWAGRGFLEAYWGERSGRASRV